MSPDFRHIEVVVAGPRTTVQDLGRRGSQRYGVSVSGALDLDAAIMGNRLVGNDLGAAVLECTFGGAELAFRNDATVAITGARADVSVSGVAMPMWSTLLAPAGSSLTIGAPVAGAHVYVAVAGGIAVDQVLRSRATHLGTKMGGFSGRALVAGDDLQYGDLSPESPKPLPGSTPPAKFDTSYVASKEPIRVVRGAQYDGFTADGVATFWGATFTVSAVSDRQGARLEGPQIEAEDGKHDIISEAAYLGAVQVPSDGQPIVLLADRQSTGGYAKIASVISADIGRMAQLPPGSELRFEEVSLETAQQMARDRYRQTQVDELTSADSFQVWRVTCNAVDRDVRVALAGRSQHGTDIWWTQLDDAAPVAAIIDPA